MKKMHEVTYERWSWFTPKMASDKIASYARRRITMVRGRPRDTNGLYKLRITIRVEIVEEPKEDD